MANSLNLFQKRTWDLCNIYNGAFVKIIKDSRKPLTIVTTGSTFDAAEILSPAFSYGVMVAKQMAFKIPFIQASRYLTGVDSYTIFETKKVREIGRGNFASVLIARHNGEEFVAKEIFCKH